MKTAANTSTNTAAQAPTCPTGGSIPAAVLEQAAGVLKVLAHPHRLRIVELLLAEQLSVGELADTLGLAAAAVSQHLNHMKAHGILGVERRGRIAYYHVTNPNACHVIECIQRHGHGRSGATDTPAHAAPSAKTK